MGAKLLVCGLGCGPSCFYPGPDMLLWAEDTDIKREARQTPWEATPGARWELAGKRAGWPIKGLAILHR